MDWAGVRVTMDKVEPLPDHIESIKSYPTPTNLTDMKSFFALVEQVAPFVMVKPYLLPFRELLKKERKFYWDENLQRIFDDVKNQLIISIKDGLLVLLHHKVFCRPTHPTWGPCPPWTSVLAG